MLIDWFTLAAQIVNFLVLVWLLKRFLWSRLIRAMDERESRIAGRLEDAAEKDREAARKKNEMDALAAEQERERGDLLARAQREAAELRLELMQRARQDVRKQESEWREDLDREKAAFLDEVRKRVASELLTVARRAVADLACADVQRCAVEALLERLQTLDVSTLRGLASSGVITVLSAVEVPEETRRRIESTLQSRLGPEIRIEFTRSPAMSWGIELRSNGRSIGWTPDSYLESLDAGLRKALETRPKALVA